MATKTITIILLGSLLLPALSFSQDTTIVTWESLQQNDWLKNAQIQDAGDALRVAKAQQNQSLSLWLPDIQASYSFLNTDNPMMAFGAKLNQQNIQQQDFAPELLNRPNGISDFSTIFEIRQPILNIDGILERRAGKMKTEALQHTKNRTREAVLFSLQKAYLSLQLAYAVKRTLKEVLETAIADQQVVNHYYSNGLVQKPDMLNMEVYVHSIENQIKQTESDINDASDNIFLLLNEPPNGKVLKPADTLAYNQLSNITPVGFDDQREDILGFRKSILAYDYLIRSVNMKFLPRLNAFGRYELHSPRVVQWNNGGYWIGLQLTWNLFDGFKTIGQKRLAQATKHKAEDQLAAYIHQSEAELRKTERQLEDAARNVGLLSEAVNQTNESYRIQANRYREGLLKAADLMQSEMQLSKKKLDYQKAVYQYNLTKAYYQLLNPKG